MLHEISVPKVVSVNVFTTDEIQMMLKRGVRQRILKRFEYKKVVRELNHCMADGK